MKECDILRGGGSKHNLTIYILPGGSGPLNPQDLCPWSQINEDTVEPSLAAQDINPITYVPDQIFAPAGFVPG